MQDLFELIDNYVKLSYVVKRLNAKVNKLPDFMFASALDCDYRALGLDEKTVLMLEGQTSLEELRRCYVLLEARNDMIRNQIYTTIFELSLADKADLYDYLSDRSFTLSVELEAMQEAYLETVVEIEQAGQADDSKRVRSLSKVAKSQYSKSYELDIIKNSYTYLGCYISGMIQDKDMKK